MCESGARGEDGAGWETRRTFSIKMLFVSLRHGEAPRKRADGDEV